MAGNGQEKPRKYTPRKTVRSRPGIPMPDARGTSEHLTKTLENAVLARLRDGKCCHLVVAEKVLRVYSLPALPGVAPEASAAPAPQQRRAADLRDHWKKGPHCFGFVVIVQGEADLLLSRRIVSCRAGDFAFLLPNTWRNQGNVSHWERPEIERADSEIIWLFWDRDGAHIHFCRSRGEEHARSPVLFVPDQKSFVLMELLSSEVVGEQLLPSSTQLIWLLLDRLLRKLREKHIFPGEHFMAAKTSPVKLGSVGARAQDYVENNLGEKLTLAIVARAIHVSRTRLVQEFCAHTGETFGAYLLRRRLEQARELLVTTSHSIEGISWVCGFSNPHYFSTVFRRRMGVTPTQFRQQQKMND